MESYQEIETIVDTTPVYQEEARDLGQKWRKEDRKIRYAFLQGF